MAEPFRLLAADGERLDVEVVVLPLRAFGTASTALSGETRPF